MFPYQSVHLQNSKIVYPTKLLSLFPRVDHIKKKGNSARNRSFSKQITWKTEQSCERHNGVHFLDRHPNFQELPGNCGCWLRTRFAHFRHWYGVNVLRTAGVSVMWPARSAHARFASLLFDPRSPKSLENTASRLSFLSQICISFFLLFLLIFSLSLCLWARHLASGWPRHIFVDIQRSLLLTLFAPVPPTRPEGGTSMNFTIKMNRILKTENSSSEGGCPLHLGVKPMPSDFRSDLKRSSWYALWRSWISQNGNFLAIPYLRSLSPDIRATCSADASFLGPWAPICGVLGAAFAWTAESSHQLGQDGDKTKNNLRYDFCLKKFVS